MEMVWLQCRETGEVVLVDWATLEQVIGVEVHLIAEVMERDGMFENGAWRSFGRDERKIRRMLRLSAKLYSHSVNWADMQGAASTVRRQPFYQE